MEVRDVMRDGDSDGMEVEGRRETEKGQKKRSLPWDARLVLTRACILSYHSERRRRW